ncbi:MAG: hypothetical protein IPL83_02705 [Bdellovibrionales bacterium]|nr:hypothetical protein [Bdellovibrionales bacterium]
MEKETKGTGSLFLGLALAVSLSYGTLSHAQESSETKAKLKDVKGDEGQKDVDQLITNKKLRAETGSKSKVSLSASFGYNGGSVEKPGNKIRPNIKAAKNETAVAGISGAVSGKYRVGEQSSLSAGVGIMMLAPFHESLDARTTKNQKGKDLERRNISDPYLTYTYLDKLAGVQSVTTVTAIAVTEASSRASGYVAGFGVDQIFMKDIGTSGLSLGLVLSAESNVFDKFTDEAKANSSDYKFGTAAVLEYVINDTFNFRTLLAQYIGHGRNAKSAWTFYQETLYQSVGLGISVTRDIFLYPNVQFLPEHPRSDRTNVALSANINVF